MGFIMTPHIYKPITEKHHIFIFSFLVFISKPKGFTIENTLYDVGVVYLSIWYWITKEFIMNHLFL